MNRVARFYTVFEESKTHSYGGWGSIFPESLPTDLYTLELTYWYKNTAPDTTNKPSSATEKKIDWSKTKIEYCRSDMFHRDFQYYLKTLEQQYSNEIDNLKSSDFWCIDMPSTRAKDYMKGCAWWHDDSPYGVMNFKDIRTPNTKLFLVLFSAMWVSHEIRADIQLVDWMDKNYPLPQWVKSHSCFLAKSSKEI